MIKSGKIVLDDSLDELLKTTNNKQSQPLTLEQIFINHHQSQAPENAGAGVR
jgi:ABC-2 type transport system ATP-binding protein